ncbi:MAG: hypothetical protein NTZ34_06295 [Chloroflexi bacterium]|nr:hypothetical protein [Chloroflexota bacterium]
MDDFKDGMSEQNQRLQEGLTILARMIAAHHMRMTNRPTFSDADGNPVDQDLYGANERESKRCKRISKQNKSNG